jgi:hypothetical protein
MIYLITGQKRAGKDFVGSILSDYLECNTYAFADDIKLILSNMFGISIEVFNNLKNENKALYLSNLDSMGVNYKRLTSFRQLIQNFGQVMKKIYGESFWVDRLILKLKDNKDENIVITDLRYFVELETLTNYFGKENITTIRVINNSLVDNDEHSSEQEMLNYKTDIVLNNTNQILNDGQVLEKVLL